MSVATIQLSSFDFASKSVKFSGVSLSPRSRRFRLIGMAVACVGLLVVLLARLYSLQVSDFETWQDWAIKQHLSELEVASERGPIYDRDGKLLAVSVPAGSIYIRPKLVKDRAGTVQELAKLLHKDPRVIDRKLSSSKPFVWLHRQMPRAVAEKIAALHIPGVGFVLETKRFYPYNQAASTLIGKVGIDGVGLSGLEGTFEKRLHGEHVTTVMGRDAMGNPIQNVSASVGEFQMPRGAALKLTIDAGLQVIMDEELELGKESAGAEGAMAIMADAFTGEILGMSQAPSVNFNDAKVPPKKALRNLAVETVFEPGSIMKPIVAAAAVESKVVQPTDIINCEHGRYLFGRHTIKDVHPSDSIPFRDVVIRSSNIGMTKVGVRLGKEKLYSYLQNFGFGELPGLGLPGETRGILRPLSQWALVDVATHSFGQGVAVTPLQMVRAVSAIANGGTLPSLRVLADEPDAGGRRIVSQKTALQIQDMMYGVVEDKHGTGKFAEIAGVRVGGKTGTAQKANPAGRGYKPGAYVASFVGFVDGTPLGLHRTLTLMVLMDEPHAKTIYGGTLAAPVFRRIMQRSLHFLATKNELENGAESTKEIVSREVTARLSSSEGSKTQS